MKQLSIIVPVWNEEENIKPLLNRIHSAMKLDGIQYEVIFVDDNSTDNTAKTINYLKNFFPVQYFKKQGKKGKAFSLFEGFSKARYDVLAMIDADLQYPPEELVGMLSKIENGADIVVARRKRSKTSKVRKLASKTFSFIFGKMLFGLDHDVQAGMKVFKKKVFNTVHFLPRSGWSFDLEFLHRARFAGYTIKDHEIIFEKRVEGKSKVSIVKTAIELISNAFSVKSKRLEPLFISSDEPNSTQNAGFGYKQKQYVTHTNINYKDSAIKTFLLRQKIFIVFVLITLVFGLLENPLLTAQILIAVISSIYFLDVFFNFWVIAKSLKNNNEISVSDEEIKKVWTNDFPVYSILCPLYKEAHVLPHFLKSIERLDYPRKKLDVLLLLEEDDKATIAAVSKIELPPYVRVIIVPDAQPKTKPKACNYGLLQAKGEYVVIYDAEDMPDPLQLKKAFLAFQKVGKKVVCLQAKLNYYNPQQNFLTRFFTAEYSLWFDLTLTGLQAAGTSIPLGGTSNHFRTEVLKKLSGWDPFNVTEDADLGIRLFNKGFKTAIIDSVTLEEANSKIDNWFRQRSRWIKGYMQTYLVHTRKFFGFQDKNPIHALYFHLTIGGKIAFILINPILWVITILYFTLTPIVGPTIQMFYPAPVLYTAVFSLVFGNFLSVYYYMIGAAKKEQWYLMKYVLFIPIYWLMMSYAACIALFQLIFKPHFWEKTVHGLHLKNEGMRQIIPDVVIEIEQENTGVGLPNSSKKRISDLFQNGHLYFGGAILVVASNVGNILSFVFNAFLGRVLSFEDFSTISLFGGLSSFASTFFTAFGTTINYRSGYLIGEKGDTKGVEFWKYQRKKSFISAFIFTVIWLAFSPFLSRYFHLESILPLVFFSPVVFYGFAAAADRGFITAKLLFGWLAVLTIVDPLTRVVLAYTFVSLKLPDIAYLSISVAFITSFIVGWIFVNFTNRKIEKKQLEKDEKKFPIQFFVVSLISSLSLVMFLSLDVVMAKHYLSARDAGQYGLISLVGKMVYFLGTLATPFIIPIVSRAEGANKNSSKTLYWSLFATFIISFVAFGAFGILSSITIPFLYGEKSIAILQLLPLFTFAMACFSLSRVFVSYYLAKKVYSFPLTTFAIAIATFIVINFLHQNILFFVEIISSAWLVSLFLMFILHFNVSRVKIVERNIGDFFGLFSNQFFKDGKNEYKQRILIFNWRDTKHIWAGGAEKYIYELSKRWVKAGSSVTIFCGNDGNSPRNQKIDGIQIIRRGGFFTVYIWAMLYYLVKFRGKFDVIVDSENGIPFFTPLFSKKPVLLLIHHVHGEVFRKHLPLIFAIFAQFLESKMMPLIYKNTQIITVSESSKQEILNLGMGKDCEIKIVNPGIDCKSFIKMKKTINPSFLYLGRLQPYKNIDVAINAFANVYKRIPSSTFTIAGDGESLEKLKELVQKLGVENSVIFAGKVSEEEKVKLLATNWILLQPSMVEGWGITVIEANASGTPVIASNVNGLKDSVVNEQTGMLVNPNDHRAFAEAMLTLATDKKLREKLSNNSLKWARNFSWEKSANDLLSEFEKQIKKPILRNQSIVLFTRG